MSFKRHILLPLITLLFCATSDARSKEEIPYSILSKSHSLIPVSVNQLLLNPLLYAGKEVAVEGYIVHEPERDAVFPSKDDADYRLNSCRLNFRVSEKGIWCRESVIKNNSTESTEFRRLRWSNSYDWLPDGLGAYGTLIGVARFDKESKRAYLSDVQFIARFYK